MLERHNICSKRMDRWRTMKISQNSIFKDIKIIDAFGSDDERGNFSKVFQDDTFRQYDLNFEIKELYYSVSQKDVIRGMHFQIPPYEHDKLVHVISGSVLDVIVDLRRHSDTYKQYITIPLSGKMKRAIFIPRGFAHGFLSLENGTVMLYCVSSVYYKDADCGIRYDSIGFDWQTASPIVSQRDLCFATLEEYESPF